MRVCTSITRVLREEPQQAEENHAQLLALVAAELEAAGGKPYADAFPQIWTIYKQNMLACFPYIGGDAASGTKNLTEAYMLVAMGEYLKGCGAEMDTIGHLMTMAYERRMLKMPRLVRRLMGKIFTTPKLLNKVLLKKDAQNAAMPQKIPAALRQRRKSRWRRAMISATTILCVPLQTLHGNMAIQNICRTSATWTM